MGLKKRHFGLPELLKYSVISYNVLCKLYKRLEKCFFYIASPFSKGIKTR